MKSARRLGDYIKEYLKNSGLKEQKYFKDINSIWSEVTPPEIAKNSNAITIRKGILTVEIESPIILQEISIFRRDDILQRLREHYPSRYIKDIKFIFSKRK